MTPSGSEFLKNRGRYHKMVLGHLLPKFEDLIPTSLGDIAISNRQKSVTVTADYCIPNIMVATNKVRGIDMGKYATLQLVLWPCV